jgi:hypothetical protein
MKLLRLATALLVSGGVLLAQETTPAQNPAPPAAAAAAAEPAAASPVPNDQKIFSGYADFGYRWVGVGGSLNTYRSVVDLGSGMKLLGTEFTILNPTHQTFDRIDVRATDWGDDPYSTLHIGVQKAHLYNFSGDYRSMAYYSNLPAFADPLLANGIVLNEQALDTRKRISTWRLDMLPNHTLSPFLEYDQSSESGNGIATFVANANEYPVYNNVTNHEQDYRGGVRIELRRFHGKIEQGGTTFKDDQGLSSSGYVNQGNFYNPVLGQDVFLTSLAEGYRIRGHSTYTDASFAANAFSWMDVYGTFLYSQPVSDVTFHGTSTGNNVLFSQLLFYTGEQSIISSVAKMPHTSANVGAEIRPTGRLRLIPSWITDRMHTDGSSTNNQILTTTAGVVPIPALLNSTLVDNSNQAEMDVYFDITHGMTLRGGYRYVWGDASDVTLPLGGLTGFEVGKIRRNVALAGFAWHPKQSAWVNIDFENGSSGSTYFRTSLYNYQRARIRGRHQITQSLGVSASFSLLNNQNPSPGIHYDFLAHQESASIQYVPKGGSLWSFEGAYTRSTLRSDIGYLDPAFLTPQRSFYRDNSHTVSALIDLNIPGTGTYKTKLTFGGSALLSSGSNPTTFYQPAAKLSVVLGKHLSFLSEWRYYGFGEAFYLYQGFRSQMVTTGFRITR